jgi:glycosyltransferase involved in cell wall biosynthesis
MNNNTCPQVSFVIPCFNEEENVAVIAVSLSQKIDKLASLGVISSQSKICFVDDGSVDSTWDIIQALVNSGSQYVGIKLTRNFGHQYALYAGLMKAKGDAVISLDADFQDDINAIDKMIDDFIDGSQIVYGVRADRESDTFFKRSTALAHYRISEMLGIKTIRNHADYRLLSRKALSMLSQYKETNIYLRGVIPLLGLKSSKVYYTRHERAAGISKYNFRSMFSLSIKGITSFSIAPLRFIAFMGLLVFLGSVLMGGWAFYAAIGGDKAIAGWASTVIPVYLFGGLQLLALGVVGEYIGKSYIEAKNRPLFLIDEIVEPTNDDH